MPTLSETLESDLNWREAELASFKIAITSAEKNSTRESALLRGAWAILYAHYEGFCKFAWDSYLDEIEKKNLLRKHLHSDVALLSLRKRLKSLRGTLSDKSLWEFSSSEFESLLSERATFEEKLETESNLWPNLYRENAKILGINPEYIEKHSAHIKTLVSRRNDIAHGQKMTIKDLNEYMEYESAALLVMHDLALCLIEAFDTEAYKAIN